MKRVAKLGCSCGSKAQYSIHGLCLKCDKLAEQQYNPSPEGVKTPTTDRGNRRLAKK